MNIHKNKRTVQTVMITLAYFLLGALSCPADEFTIFTPRITPVSASRSSEMSREEIIKTDLAYAKIIEDNRWRAVIKSGSSRLYNSHGYAWQVYGGGAPVNIGNREVARFWTDGSYRQIKRHQAGRGDIVVMMDRENPKWLHSAVVINARWCISKWGHGPLVLHRLNDHPFGRTYRYYQRVKRAAPSGLTTVRRF